MTTEVLIEILKKYPNHRVVFDAYESGVNDLKEENIGLKPVILAAYSPESARQCFGGEHLVLQDHMDSEDYQGKVIKDCLVITRHT